MHIQGCIHIAVRLKSLIVMKYCFHAVGIFPLPSLRLNLPSPFADSITPSTMRYTHE